MLQALRNDDHVHQPPAVLHVVPLGGARAVHPRGSVRLYPGTGRPSRPCRAATHRRARAKIPKFRENKKEEKVEI